MAAWLSSRAALVERSTSIPTGAVVGATIGSVVGVTLISLCLLPFILRARRLRAFRRQHGDDATIEAFGQPDFLSRSHIGDAFRKLSHSTPSQPPPKAYAAGDGQESTDQNADAIEKPQTALYPIGVNVQHGLPSPISPPLPAATRFEPLPGRALQDGRTATGSLTLATQTTRDSIPGQKLSQEQSVTDAGTSSKQQSISDSFASPSRRGTSGSRGITDGPEALGLGRKPSHRRRSSHLSDSVRHLAQRASAALRRESTMSTGSIRSPPIAPADDLPEVASAPAAFEAIDTEARGEAYSYYHGFDAPESQPAPVPKQESTSGPPLSILTTSTAASAPLFHLSPESASTVASISPVYPDWLTSQLTPLTSRPMFGHGPGETRGIHGPNGPPERMGTQPMKPIVSDIPSRRSKTSSRPTVNPMDVWEPTTIPEKDHKTLVDLSTASPAARLDQTSPARPDPTPAARPHSTPPMVSFPSQPTADATLTPELGRRDDMDVDMDGEHGGPVVKQEPSPDGMTLPLPPQVAVTGGDIDMMEPSGLYTPPASLIPSTPTTPGYISDQPLPSGPAVATPSPRSNDDHNNQSDSSPRIYTCDYCKMVFDQYHKLNHHKRYHARPHICSHPGCTMRFGTKTHLERHVNDKHTKSKHYFCTQLNCPYSRQGGRSFPRKDNWRRHMQNKHNITNPPDPESPDPEEVTMDGTEQQQLPLVQAQAQVETMYDKLMMGSTGQPGGPPQGPLMSELEYAHFLATVNAQQHPLGPGQQRSQYR